MIILALLYKIECFSRVSATNQIDNLTFVRLFMVISHVSIIMKVLFTIRVYGVCWAANMFDWKSKIYFSR